MTDTSGPKDGEVRTVTMGETSGDLFGDPSETLVEMERLAEIIRVEILAHDPIDMLATLWRQFFSEANAPKSAKLAPDPIGRFQFALEYLHAILAGAPAPQIPPVDLTSESIKRILGLLEELRTVTMWHCMARCHASEGRAFGGASSDVEFKAHSTWISIRGHRYSAIEGEFFRYVLAPHDEELARQHGANADAIADGIQSAADATRFGIMRAHEQYAGCMKKAEALRKEQRLGLEEAMQKLGRSDAAFRDAYDEAVDVVERASNCNLSRSSTLPDSVLDDLSYSRGDNNEFFADGAYRGTPLRTLPARLRPLIKFDDGTYAIDGQFLRDSAYRAIQRGLLARNPAYRNEWNRRQKQRAETAFADIFERQLTGAFIATDVFYPDPDTGQWAETDLVVILDDTLIVLEAKAGVTAMDNPATDFHRHARAIQGLVLDAYSQASRFIRYLTSADQVPIYQRGTMVLKSCGPSA